MEGTRIEWAGSGRSSSHKARKTRAYSWVRIYPYSFERATRFMWELSSLGEAAMGSTQFTCQAEVSASRASPAPTQAGVLM
jgi:hypothetical protein